MFLTLYERYRRSAIDFSKLGLERGDTRSDYFCTPKGTTVIGWTGVDGIHYCLVKGFQEVFSVSPMEGEGQCVHPVARDSSPPPPAVSIIRASGGYQQTP